MQTDFANLLTSLLCLLPGCLGILGLVGVGALLLRGFSRARQLEGATAGQGDLHAEVEALMGEVRDWLLALALWNVLHLAAIQVKTAGV